jgi:ubiquinone/menaquinone biosynthesis C-methylase UbiE
MWESLGPVFAKISNHILGLNRISSLKDLNLLDIGSGSGLSTELLLRTNLSNKIKEITLLDSSSVMIEVSGKRVKQWGKNVRFINGYIEHEQQGQYDIILCCSVLHHIPNLENFFLNISKLQNPGGMFIHLQDPSGDVVNSKEYKNRIKELSDYKGRKTENRTFRQLVYKWRRKLFAEDFIGRVNTELIKQGVIRKRLTERELWSITDIHVEDLPYSANDGISLSRIAKLLPGYSLTFKTSYAFFGDLSSSLPLQFQERENSLFSKDSMEGRLLAGVWIKNA